MVFILMAALCAAFANFCFRRFSNGKKSYSGGYLLAFFIFSFLSIFVLYPAIWYSSINLTLLLIGFSIGLFNFTMMQFTAQALKIGPAGLTFAFQNVSAIFPSIILITLFGDKCGFNCTPFQIIGMIIIVFGLFLGARSGADTKTRLHKTWLFYALCCLLSQVIALSIIQGRYFIFGLDPNQSTDMDDAWFMLGQFIFCMTFQALFFLKQQRLLFKREIAFGAIGGLANFGSTLFMLLGTQYALPSEKAMLFPLSAVSIIVFCNMWASFIYKEKFNFKTNSICSLGILLGSLGK